MEQGLLQQAADRFKSFYEKTNLTNSLNEYKQIATEIKEKIKEKQQPKLLYKNRQGMQMLNLKINQAKLYVKTLFGGVRFRFLQLGGSSIPTQNQESSKENEAQDSSQKQSNINGQKVEQINRHQSQELNQLQRNQVTQENQSQQNTSNFNQQPSYKSRAEFNQRFYQQSKAQMNQQDPKDHTPKGFAPRKTTQQNAENINANQENQNKQQFIDIQEQTQQTAQNQSDQGQVVSFVKSNLGKAIQTGQTIVKIIKRKAVAVWEYIEEKIISKFKNKEGRRQIVQQLKQTAQDVASRIKQEVYNIAVKIKETVYDLLNIKREEARAAKPENKSKYSELFKKLGIDIDAIKESARQNTESLVQFGFFNPNKFDMIFSETTDLREPTKLDKMRRDFKIWRREKLFQMYGYYKSEDVQERIASFKNIFWTQTDNLQQGLVKYKKIAFWWQPDQSKYFGNSKFRKFWNFRKAQKEGVLDFYMTTVLIVGGSVILFGVYRGYRKANNKKTGYKESVNQLKAEELAIEMERLQLLLEIDQLEEEELREMKTRQSKLQITNNEKTEIKTSNDQNSL
eukprot:403330876